MKALTIWQPWASLIIAGWKPHEFRGYPAPRPLRGQRVVIHAGVRPIRKAEVRALLIKLAGGRAWETGLDMACFPFLRQVLQTPGMLPLGAGLGTVLLGEPVRANRLLPDPDVVGAPEARWNWGWPLTDIERFEPPVPSRGFQGFWEWQP